MYLGQLIAYPIWLYVGISVLFIVGSAIKNNKGQANPTPSTIAKTTQKNNKKTQKSIDKDYKRVYNIIIKEIKKSPTDSFIKGQRKVLLMLMINENKTKKQKLMIIKPILSLFRYKIINHKENHNVKFHSRNQNRNNYFT